MKILNIAIAALALLSLNSNAVIINNLDGNDYQWLELTATTGQSRLEIEAQLNDVNSDLYGYQYASRSLVESLLLSYTSWDGQNNWHGDSNVVAGIASMINDFGITNTTTGDGINSLYNTVDGYQLNFDSYIRTGGLFGTTDECGIILTCYTKIQLGLDADGNTTMATQFGRFGWDSTEVRPFTRTVTATSSTYGSYLYTNISSDSLGMNLSPVPLPAAIYLFAVGLLGLLGISRRKTNI